MRQSIADNDITYLMSFLDSNILAIATYKVECKIELSDLEESQLVFMEHVNFRVHENAFYQFEQGLLEPEIWKRNRIIIKYLLKNHEASKKMWKKYANLFTDSFQNEVKQLLNKDNSLINDSSIISEDSVSKTN